MAKRSMSGDAQERINQVLGRSENTSSDRKQTPGTSVPANQKSGSSGFDLSGRDTPRGRVNDILGKSDPFTDFKKSLNPEVLENVRNKYREKYFGDKNYYDYTGGEIYAQGAGEMPEYLKGKYNLNDQYDKWLYDNGLPYSSVFNDLYSEAARDYNEKIQKQNASLQNIINGIDQYEQQKAGFFNGIANGKTPQELLATGDYDTYNSFYNLDKKEEANPYLARQNQANYSAFDKVYDAIYANDPDALNDALTNEFWEQYSDKNWQKYLNQKLAWNESDNDRQLQIAADQSKRAWSKAKSDYDKQVEEARAKGQVIVTPEQKRAIEEAMAFDLEQANEDMASLTQQMKAAKAQIAGLRSAGWSVNSKKVQEAQAQYDEAQAKLAEISEKASTAAFLQADPEQQKAYLHDQEVEKAKQTRAELLGQIDDLKQELGPLKQNGGNQEQITALEAQIDDIYGQIAPLNELINQDRRDKLNREMEKADTSMTDEEIEKELQSVTTQLAGYRQTDGSYRETEESKLLIERKEHLEQMLTLTQTAGRALKKVNEYIAQGGTDELADVSKWSRKSSNKYKALTGQSKAGMSNLPQFATEEEIAAANAAALKGEDEFNEYCDALETVLKQRSVLDRTEKTEEYAQRNASQASLVSAGMNLLAAAEGAGNILSALPTGRANAVDMMYAGRMTSAASQIRNTVSDTIQRNNSDESFIPGVSTGEIYSFLYQSGMSMLDSAVRIPLGNAGLALTGLSAADSTILDQLEQGATTRQALTLGVVAGIAEVLTEKVSLESLLEAKAAGNIGQFVKETLKQMITEGSEEIASEVINIIAEAATLEDTDFTAKGLVSRILEAGIGGFVSGLGFGLGGQVVQTSAAGGFANVRAAQNLAAEILGTNGGNGKVSGQFRAQYIETVQKSGLNPQAQEICLNLLDQMTTDNGFMATAEGQATLEGLKGLIESESRKAQVRVKEFEAEEARNRQRLSKLYDNLQNLAEQARSMTNDPEGHSRLYREFMSKVQEYQDAQTAEQSRQETAEIKMQEAQRQTEEKILDAVEKTANDYTQLTAALSEARGADALAALGDQLAKAEAVDSIETDDINSAKAQAMENNDKESYNLLDELVNVQRSGNEEAKARFADEHADLMNMLVGTNEASQQGVGVNNNIQEEMVNANGNGRNGQSAEGAGFEGSEAQLLNNERGRNDGSPAERADEARFGRSTGDNGSRAVEGSESGPAKSWLGVDHTKLFSDLAEDYNNDQKLEGNNRIKASDFQILSEPTNDRSAEILAKAIARNGGGSVYLYRSTNPNAPNGFFYKGNIYINDTGDGLVAFYYAHEYAHSNGNDNAIQTAGRKVWQEMQEEGSDALDRYCKKWGENPNDPKIMNEFIADIRGAYEYAIQNNQAVHDQLGLTAQEAARFYEAFAEVEAESGIISRDDFLKILHSAISRESGTDFSSHNLDKNDNDKGQAVESGEETQEPTKRIFINYGDEQQAQPIREKKLNELIADKKYVELSTQEVDLDNDYNSVSKDSIEELTNYISKQLEKNGIQGVSLSVEGNHITANIYHAFFEHAARSVKKNTTDAKAFIKIAQLFENAEYMYSSPHENTHSKTAERSEVELWDSYLSALKYNNTVYGFEFMVRQMAKERGGEYQGYNFKEIASNVYLAPSSKEESRPTYIDANNNKADNNENVNSSSHNIREGVNYDEQGKPISLSQRFNDQKDDFNYASHKIVDPKTVPLIDPKNIERYRLEVDAVFSGDMPSGKKVTLGMPSKVLLDHGVPNTLINMTQSVIRKIAYPEGYMKGKHNLGFSVVKELPYQLNDPMAITNNTEKQQKLGESKVVWTEWEDQGKSIIIPISINRQGAIDLENVITTVFNGRDEYLDQFIKAGVLYTRNNEDIYSLLSNRRHVPDARADDVLTSFLTQHGYDVNNFSSHNLQEGINAVEDAVVKNAREAQDLYNSGETMADYMARTVYNPEVARQLGGIESRNTKAPTGLTREQRAQMFQWDRERLDAQLSKMKASERSAVLREREKMQQRQDRVKYGTDVVKRSKELLKWMTAPNVKEGKYVPDVFKDAVNGVLQGIDLGSNDRIGGQKVQSWRRNMMALATTLQQYQAHQEGRMQDGRFEGFELDLPNGFVEDFTDLANSITEEGTNFLQDMNADQLRRLDKSIAIIQSGIKGANRMHANARYATVSDAAEATIREQEGRRKYKNTGLRAVEAVRSMVNSEMLDLESYAQRLGDAGGSVVREIANGFLKGTTHIKEAQEFFDSAREKEGITKKDVHSWTKKTVTQQLESGETISMTEGQLMNLYALSVRQQAMSHILQGGIELAYNKSSKGNQNRAYQLTYGDLDNLFSHLSDKQKKFVGDLQRYLSETASGWGNEVSQELYGIDMYGEEFYWPIRSAKAGLATQDPEKVRAFNAIQNSSFTNATVRNASNPIMLDDCVQTFCDHIAQMANYNGMAVPIGDAMKWFNYKSKSSEGATDWNSSVKRSITDVMGKDGTSYFINLIKDINGLSEGGTGTDLPSALVANTKKAAVAAKIRVMIQQPTAVVRAMSMIDPKYFVGLDDIHLKQVVNEMQENAPIAWWKAQGNFDIGTGKSMRDIISGDASAYENFVNATMAGAGAMDDLGWSWIWNAVKREQQARHPGWSSEQLMPAVVNRFTDVINKTQVIDTVVHRSQIMRSKDNAVKQTTAFMSEPIKTFNLLHNALNDVIEGKPGAKKRLGRTAVAVAGSWALNAAVTALHDALKYRDDDDDLWDQIIENWKGDFLDNVLLVNSIPYVKDVFALAKGESLNRMDMSAIADLIDSAQAVGKYLSTGSTNYTDYGLLRKFVTALGNVAGTPLTGLIADAELLVNMLAPGSVITKKTKNWDKADTLIEQGINKNQARGLMKNYDASTNGTKALSILTYDGNKDGKPDFDKSQQDLIAEVLGISYDPAKDGSLESYARKSVDTYLKGKEKDVAKGKITEEKYEEYKDFYDYYFELLSGGAG